MSPTDDLSEPCILDTDIFSILAITELGDARFPQLIARIRRAGAGRVFLSAVTLEESVRGALAEIRREETKGKGTSGYALLTRLVLALAKYPVLPYDDAADQIFRAFPAAVKRTGSADCKIAAVAQAHGAVVVTRNVRHYASIPGTRFEDWTLPDQSPT